MTRTQRTGSIGWRLLLLVLATVASLMGGMASDALAGPAVRPAAVPRDAFWLGGADGGVFVRLTSSGDDVVQVVQAQIFHENGQLWYRGRLALQPPGGAAVDVRDTRQFAGWDGHTLWLTDGRALVARPSRLRPK